MNNGQLEIRHIHAGDLFGLRRARWNFVDAGLLPIDSQQPALTVALPIARGVRRAFVASIHQRACGLIEIETDPHEYRWLISRLGITMTQPMETFERMCSSVDIWTELLLAAVRAAALSGAKRLHATPPVDTPALASFRKAAFINYAEETVFMTSEAIHARRAEVPVREQEPSDTWSVHQLYHRATPHPIQYVHAFTSNHWDTSRSVRAFLAERDHELIAYCRVAQFGGDVILEPLALPGEASILPGLIFEALVRCRAGRRNVIWVGIADYHREYQQALLDLGFSPVDRRACMVRYTAVPARVSLERAGSLADVVDRLTAPARLPSYSVRHPAPERTGTGEALTTHG